VVVNNNRFAALCPVFLLLSEQCTVTKLLVRQKVKF